jgi:hypothetical protein
MRRTAGSGLALVFVCYGKAKQPSDKTTNRKATMKQTLRFWAITAVVTVFVFENLAVVLFFLFTAFNGGANLEKALFTQLFGFWLVSGGFLALILGQSRQTDRLVAALSPVPVAPPPLADAVAALAAARKPTPALPAPPPPVAAPVRAVWPPADVDWDGITNVADRETEKLRRRMSGTGP